MGDIGAELHHIADIHGLQKFNVVVVEGQGLVAIVHDNSFRLSVTTDIKEAPEMDDAIRSCHIGSAQVQIQNRNRSHKYALHSFIFAHAPACRGKPPDRSGRKTYAVPQAGTASVFADQRCSRKFLAKNILHVIK